MRRDASCNSVEQQPSREMQDFVPTTVNTLLVLSSALQANTRKLHASFLSYKMLVRGNSAKIH